jgi:hypothetical protein
LSRIFTAAARSSRTGQPYKTEMQVTFEGAPHAALPVLAAALFANATFTTGPSSVDGTPVDGAAAAIKAIAAKVPGVDAAKVRGAGRARLRCAMSSLSPRSLFVLAHREARMHFARACPLVNLHRGPRSRHIWLFGRLKTLLKRPRPPYP